jgi:hypothetical protein
MNFIGAVSTERFYRVHDTCLPCMLHKLLSPFMLFYIIKLIYFVPITAAALFKACVYGGLHAGDAGSNPARVHGCLSLVSVVCCRVEVSATGRSLIQRSPTECGASNWL